MTDEADAYDICATVDRGGLPVLAHPAATGSGRWRTFFSVAAAVLDLGALGVSFLPVGATSCSGYSTAVAPGQPAGPARDVCHAAPTIVAFQSAIPLLVLMIALGLVPLLTLKMRQRWPSVASAVVQAAFLLLSMGGFLFWVPAWLFTIAAAVAPPAA